MKNFIFIIVFILSGCTVLPTELNSNLEIDKTASLFCSGNYKVLNNGNVVDSTIQAFDFSFKNNIELPELAQQNLDNHLACLDIAKKYSYKYKINTSKLSDSEVFELRQFFLDNFQDIAIEVLQKEKPEETKVLRI